MAIDARPRLMGPTRKKCDIAAIRCSAALDAEGLVVERDVFGARMDIELTGDGPVTIVLP